MIGIDLTIISRFKGKEKKFANRILTREEQKEFELSENKTNFIATRWAIKEALFKADNSLSNYAKLNIIKKEGIYTFRGYEISTSNETDLVIAIVLKKEK